jgi:lysyl-tRNA synthetase class 2
MTTDPDANRPGPSRADAPQADATGRAPARATQPAPDVGATPTPTLTPDQYEAQRRANRDEVKELGLSAYGHRVDDLQTLADARARYDEAADRAFADAQASAKAAAKAPGATGTSATAASTAPVVDARPRVCVAGRVMLLRDNGKLIWLTLRDHTGDLQVAVSQRDVDEQRFKLAKHTDLGDLLVARGRLMKTKTGEVTVWCDGLDALEPGAKALVPPPDKHAGLADAELRYRRRYVDMWVNPETTRVFALRSRIVQCVREHLALRGYLEVETPMLQTLAGGAAARPFQTHMHALDIGLFMRIAPELYLKRLLVGGLPRVFEINRNFRNEGLDKQHNPEFTMLEAYHAFGDVQTVMDLTESVVRACAVDVARQAPGADPASHGATLPFGELSIDYARPFERVAYGELFRRHVGFEMTDRARVVEACAKAHIKTQGVDHWFLVNELFEEHAETKLDPARPTFITDYPSAISPLTRPKPDNPELADRADLFIGGMEIAPHYTELNDPDIQAAKFREQLATGDEAKNAEERAFRTFDADFITALKVGMPPAGGMGLGIDRLVMLLTNQRTIRDVVLFPLMRPLE